MSFTLRLVKGSALTWAEFDNNLSEIEAKWLEALDASALAQAAANFQGNWTALTGPLAVPASVRHNGEYWMLLNDLANVATSQPGVSADWSVIGNLRKSGDTMTGPLAQAAGTAALPSYTFSGDTNTGIYSPGADRVGIATAGAQRVEVDASGNVGVGKTPAYNFDIRNPSGNTTLNIDAFGGTSSVLRFGSPTFSTIESASVLNFFINSAERLRIDTIGNVLVTGSGGLGYGVGSGGTVTQATNKGTSVTLNKPSGQITMNAAALAAGATVQFTLNNTLITATDTIILCAPGSINYQIWGYGTGGGAVIYVKNISAGALSDPVAINFAVIKGATS